jgi:hypothetical protein
VKKSRHHRISVYPTWAGHYRAATTQQVSNHNAQRAGLAQLIRFLMMELIYLDSNPKFNKGVVFTINYSFNGR